MHVICAFASVQISSQMALISPLYDIDKTPVSWLCTIKSVTGYGGGVGVPSVGGGVGVPSVGGYGVVVVILVMCTD